MKDLMGSRWAAAETDDESCLGSPTGACPDGLRVRLSRSSWVDNESVDLALRLHEEKPNGGEDMDA